MSAATGTTPDAVVAASAPDLRSRLATYLVTDTAQCGDRGVVDVVTAALAGGVTTVQVRDKTASGRDLLALTRAVAHAAAGRATVLVDDRVDVFLAARATGAPVHGVHVGQRDLPAEVVRQLVGATNPDGSRAVVGLSASTLDEVSAVHDLPAGTVDYLGVGAVRPTATKPDHPAPLGVDGFAAVARATSLPCVAIGGIAVDLVGPLRRAGAAGAAVVSAVCAAPDPAAAAAALAAAWEGAR
ncbi:thiamine phosphate synthase [Isoptericola cucumis]|uniref:Thiamine-phosphate synthase n=1 Tax=Isoptericola cucumis TaxID=1776856 RepID=A0ABQ2B3N8_9MICO|nr:thiamine phosphate synthase [Isoptericola cucumis]GGI07178.1 thiamine-phosphate synthase [Isoptericola cucumis]